MTPALAQASAPVALELYALLRDLDPSRWREGIETALRERAATIERRLSALLERGTEAPTLRERLAELEQLLRERVPGPELAHHERRDRWASLREQLNRGYESLCLALEEQRGARAAAALLLPTVRPTNYTRSLFHFGVSLFSIVMVEHVLPARWVMLVPTILAASFWSLEGLRRVSTRANDFLLWLFRLIVHPHERYRYRVNSATWYCSAIAILGTFFRPEVCCAALAVVGVADPFAAFVGRRWGKHRIAAERTLEGSLGFVIAGTLAAFVAIRLWHGELPLGHSLWIALAAAVVGGIAELASSRRFDDNFTVPVTAAIASALTMRLLG